MSDRFERILDVADAGTASSGHDAGANPSQRDIAMADLDCPRESEVPDVLLLHGQPGSSLIWTQVQTLLHGRGLHALAVDRPGYGATGGPAMDHSGNAATLAQILDERQCTPAVVVGHSLGAGIAVALAAAAPHHVRALVLVAPAVGSDAVTATDRALAVPVLGAGLSWLGFRTVGLMLCLPGLRRRVLTDRIGLSATEGKEVVRRMTRGSVWRSFAVEQRYLVADADRLQEQLGEVRCPVMVLAGARDRVVRPRVAAVMASRLSESTLITTDTGHLIPIDDPEAVVNAVLRALRWEYRRSLFYTRSTAPVADA